MDSELNQRTELVAKALDVLAKNAAASAARGVVPPLYLSLLKAASAMKKHADVFGSLNGLIAQARAGMDSVKGFLGRAHGAVASPGEMLAAALRNASIDPKDTAAIDAFLRANPVVRAHTERASGAALDRAADAFGSRIDPLHALAATVAAGGVGYGLGRGPNQQDRGRSTLPVVYAS